MTAKTENRQPEWVGGFLFLLIFFNCGTKGGNYVQSGRKILGFRIKGLQNIFGFGA
jgi:hypothetical protein